MVNIFWYHPNCQSGEIGMAHPLPFRVDCNQTQGGVNLRSYPIWNSFLAVFYFRNHDFRDPKPQCFRACGGPDFGQISETRKGNHTMYRSPLTWFSCRIRRTVLWCYRTSFRQSDTFLLGTWNWICLVRWHCYLRSFFFRFDFFAVGGAEVAGFPESTIPKRYTW